MEPADSRSPQTQEEFFKHFTAERLAVEDKIDRLATGGANSSLQKEAVDNCLAAISRLSNNVKDASEVLASYDQRSYSTAIKALSDKLSAAREASAPRSKFSFKNKLRASEAGSSDRRSEAEDNTVRSTAPQPQKSLLAGLDGEYKALAPSTTQHTPSGVIANVNGSVIDASPPAISGIPPLSLTFRNLTESLVLSGRVQGPVHITGLRNCVLVVACRQFRMHEASGCDIYLHCSSNPIIEDCSNVRFAPLPPHFETNWVVRGENKWDMVDDFNWLRPDANPHWQRLAAADHVSEETWQRVTPERLSSPIELESLLRAVGARH